MGFFRELPNLLYPSFLPEKTSSLDFIEVKNIFRRVKIRDDLQSSFTVFNKYEIPMGSRPDMVAEELYGVASFDWIVLTVAGILNVRNEWPLSNRDLYNYSLDKYGDSINSNRFFETTEVKDSSGRLILPKGKVVDSGFTIPDPSSSTATINPVGGVTNYEYESKLNDEKRSIYIISPGYLQIFLNDMKDIMRYTDSSQFVNTNLIQTENTRNTDPN